MEINKIILGDCREVLKTLPDNSIDCCVTSPPYFGLRDYGHEDQIGLETTPESFVECMVAVFTEVKRVLKKEGTLWLNLGDSYASNTKGSGGPSEKQLSNSGSRYEIKKFNHGVKEKDLMGIPWLVAFALRKSGWYLRQDIIWHKPNPMPESVTDRCTKSHEYIFLLSKSAKYYYDADAIKEDAKTYENRPTGVERNRLFNYDSKINNNPDAFLVKKTGRSKNDCGGHSSIQLSGRGDFMPNDGMINKRSVWTVTTKPFSEAHFATFPEDLIVDCIKAGCPENGIVLDPFMGAGTTALVAAKLNRNYVGCELNPDYIAIAEKRLFNELGLFGKAS